MVPTSAEEKGRQTNQLTRLCQVLVTSDWGSSWLESGQHWRNPKVHRSEDIHWPIRSQLLTEHTPGQETGPLSPRMSLSTMQQQVEAHLAQLATAGCI